MNKETYRLVGEFCDQCSGTAGATGLIRLVLSLYDGHAWSFSIPNCIGKLDERRLAWARQIIDDYIEHGATEELIELGKRFSGRIPSFEWSLDFAALTNDALLMIRHPSRGGLAQQIAMFAGEHGRPPEILFTGAWMRTSCEPGTHETGGSGVWPGRIDDPGGFLLQAPDGAWLEVEPMESSFVILK